MQQFAGTGSNVHMSALTEGRVLGRSIIEMLHEIHNFKKSFLYIVSHLKNIILYFEVDAHKNFVCALKVRQVQLLNLNDLL